MALLPSSVTLLTILPAILLICEGCASYTPVLALPASPLSRASGEVVGGYGAQVVGDDFVTDGIHASARYAFTDRVTLGGVIWTTNETIWNAFSIDGIGADGMFVLSDSTESVRFGIVARYNWLFEGNTLAGLVAVGGGVVWLPEIWEIRPFAALQLGYGWSTASGSDTDVDAALILQEHIGGAVQLPWRFQIRGELAFVQERFRLRTGAWDSRIMWSFLPSASLAWSFELE